MTLVDVIEVLFPILRKKIEVGKPFPCPLAMHLPGDDGLMSVSDEGDELGWKCDSGCAGDKWKNAYQFISNALGVDTLNAFDLWHRLRELESQQDRIDYIAEKYPHWYPREGKA